MLVTLNLTGVLGCSCLIWSGDQIIPTLITTCFSPLAGSLLLAVPIAAMMSTIDSLCPNECNTHERYLHASWFPSTTSVYPTKRWSKVTTWVVA